MSYDKFLNAPSWDDNGHSPAIINELSNTFARTEVHEEPNWGEEFEHDEEPSHMQELGEVSHKEQDDDFHDQTLDNSLYRPASLNNEPFGSGILEPNDTLSSNIASPGYLANVFQETAFPGTNIFETPETTKKNLLSELAPEEDPLSAIKNAAIKDTQPLDGDLFIHTDRSPIKAYESNDDISSSVVSPTKAHGTKPTMLFKIQRKHVLQKNAKKPESVDQKMGLDPLAKILKQSEFVDEPLDDVETPDQNASNTQITTENVEKPLQEQPHVHMTDKKLPHKPLEAQKNNFNEDMVTIEPVYEIEVTDPVKVSDITSSHIEYKVKSKTNSGEQHSVSRRYRDFRWLYRQLQSNHWGCIIPPPPDKQMLNMLANDLETTRRAQMSLMLNKIASNPATHDDTDFFEFLTYEGAKFSTYSKSRDQESLAHSVNDSNDLSEVYMSEINLFGPSDGIDFHRQSGGLDVESYLKKRVKGGGFLSFYAAATPKYTEPDDYFTTQQESIVLLKTQLKDIYKAFELVEQEKIDLAAVTKEFATSFNSLIELDVTPQLTKVYQNFADVHMKLQDSLDRNSQMEHIVLGSTIEEHLRSLSSCTAIFNQRSKLGSILVFLEQLLQNTKISLSKAKSDKIPQQEEELKQYEVKCQQVKQLWKRVGETIKCQMSAFDKQRIVEFRNSIEIYLESEIESQKETIEIWETFYQTAL